MDPLLNIRRLRLCLRPGLALAHTPAYARENIPAMHLCTASRSEVNQKKTKVMMLNVSNPAAVKVNGEDLPTTEGFSSFGSTVRHDGGADIDIRNRLSKDRKAFRMLNRVWKSSQYSTQTTVRLYQSCVLSTLLYGSECWRMTESA